MLRERVHSDNGSAYDFVFHHSVWVFRQIKISGFVCKRWSVRISVSAVMAAGGFALTATHFSRRRKVSKRLRPGVRHFAKAQCSLAPVSIRGHRLRSASRRPPLDVCGSAARRYAPNPLMNTYARPAEGAKDQKQIKIKIKIKCFASEFTPTMDRYTTSLFTILFGCLGRSKSVALCVSVGLCVYPFLR
jgi:hypothetical protein